MEKDNEVVQRLEAILDALHEITSTVSNAMQEMSTKAQQSAAMMMALQSQLAQDAQQGKPIEVPEYLRDPHADARKAGAKYYYPFPGQS